MVQEEALEGEDAPDLVLAKPASLSDLRQAFRSLEAPVDAGADRGLSPSNELL